MTTRPITLVWRIIIGIAAVMGAVGLSDTYDDYRRGGALKWSHVAVSIAIPAVAVLLAVLVGRRQSARR